MVCCVVLCRWWLGLFCIAALLSFIRSFVHLVSHSPNKKFSRYFLCYETDEYWSHFHFIVWIFCSLQRLVNFKSNSIRRIDCSFDRHRLYGDDDRCDRHRLRSLFHIDQMNLLKKTFSILCLWNPLTHSNQSQWYIIQYCKHTTNGTNWKSTNAERKKIVHYILKLIRLYKWATV